MKPLALALCILSLSACASLSVQRYDYAASLVEVTRPSDAADRYSAPITAEPTDDGEIRYLYADSLINAALIYMRDRVAFEIENKADQSMRILWDEAAFVGPDGRSERVMHAGVVYAERSAPMAPSVIARGSSVTDFAMPSSKAEYFRGVGWYHVDLLSPANARAGTLEQAQANVGRRFSLLLPLEIAGEVNEYTFEFEVTGLGLAE